MNIHEKVIQSRKLLKKLCDLIQKETDAAEKLKLIELAATFNQYCKTGIYTVQALESELVEISKNIEFPDAHGNYEENTVLHIMTECYNIGGHTRLVDTWINFDESAKHSIYIVNVYSSVPDWLESSVHSSGGSIIKANVSDFIENAIFLYNTSLDYEKIILHIHPNDVVPSLAFGHEKWKSPIYFCDHADSSASLGASISDVLLEMNSEYVDVNRVRRGVSQAYALHIPIKQKSCGCANGNGAIKEELGIPENAFICVSMATDYKYTAFEPYNFFSFCEQLISLADNIYFIIIGAKSSKKKWVTLNTKSNGRIIPLLPIYDKEKLSDIFSISNLYIDSFMYNSFTSLLEAVAHNIPAVALKTYFMRLDALEKLYEDNIGQLLLKIKSYYDNDLDVSEVIRETNERLSSIDYKDAWVRNMREIVYSQNVVHTINTDFAEPDIITTDFESMRLLQKAMSKILRMCIVASPSLFSLKKKTRIKAITSFYKSGIFNESFMCDVFIREKNLSKIWKFCKKHDKVYIYGTGALAKQCVEYIRANQLEYEGFVVSDDRCRQTKLGDKKIIPVSEIIKDKDSCGIILALNKKNQSDVLPYLRDHEFDYILRL